MKVCLINNLYKPYARGGAETYVEKLFLGFSERGDDVFVISTKPYKSKTKEENNVYYLKSFYYSLSTIPKFLRIFWHFFNIFNFLNYYKIKKIIKKEKPDLVITNNLLGLSFLLPSLFKSLGLKHLHILHDIQLLHPSGLMYLGKEDIIDSFFAKIYQKINIYLFSSLKYIIAPSNWIINTHKEKGFFKNAKTHRFFNPINSILIEKKNIKKDSFDFLYVGQIEEHKGVIEVFDILNSLMNNNNDLNFSVIGSGSLLGDMKKRYSGSRIRFLGKINKEDIFRHMSMSDCLLVPSLCYENSPTVIYEAAICDLNYIYSDFAGASEIGKYFGGVGYDPKDENSIKRTIANIAQEKNKRKEKKSPELSSNDYLENLLLFIKVI